MIRSGVFINAGLFQASWFTAVIGAAHGRSGIGPIAIATWVAFHLALSRERVSELATILAAIAVGYVTDSLLVSVDVYRFHDDNGIVRPTRIWMLALWANLGATLRSSLAWLRGRTARAAASGALSAPLAYYGAAKIGAIAIPSPLPPRFTAIATGGALAVAAIAAFASAWDRPRGASTESPP